MPRCIARSQSSFGLGLGLGLVLLLTSPHLTADRASPACCLQRPPRASHCRETNRCVERLGLGLELGLGSDPNPDPDPDQVRRAVGPLLPVGGQLDRPPQLPVVPVLCHHDPRARPPARQPLRQRAPAAGALPPDTPSPGARVPRLARCSSCCTLRGGRSMSADRTHRCRGLCSARHLLPSPAISSHLQPSPAISPC